MQYTIPVYFLYFIIIAVCGWFMEITLQLITKHKFADRGFLIGPYCPIYGCGALLITIFLTRFESYPVALFCVAIVVCAVLEYATSYVMEKIFHARWWDYSENKFNINGRICLETIIPFGLLGVGLIYIVNPFIFKILTQLPENTINIAAIIIAIIFAIDNIISFKVILNVRLTSRKLDKENPKDNTEEMSKKVIEFLRSKSFLNRRLLDAFPKLTMISNKIKEKTAEVKEGIATKANEMKEDITEKANVVKKDINKKATKMKNDVKNGIYKTSKVVKENISKVKKSKQ